MNHQNFNEKRLQILQFIEKNPGVILSQISNSLKIPNATLLHHINILKQNDQLELKNNIGRKRYFTKSFADNEIQIINSLRVPTSKAILIHILNSNEVTFHSLVKSIRKSKSTISAYLTKLLYFKIVEYRIEERVRYYHIKNKLMVKNILENYDFN